MGETSKTIGELGEEFQNQFLELVRWEFVKGAFDIEYETDILKTSGGKAKKTHGIDGVCKYEDPYVNREIYVIVSTKSIAWKKTNTSEERKTVGAIAKKIQEWTDELNSKVAIARRASDFKSKIGVDEGAVFDVVGLLFYFVHDELFKDEVYREVLEKSAVTRSDLVETVYVLSNREITRANTVINHLHSKRKISSDSIEYNYPSTDLFPSKKYWCDYLTLPHYFSMFWYMRISNESYVAYFGDLDQQSIDYFMASLAHFQVFRETKVSILIYKKQSLNDADIKSMFHNREVEFGEVLSTLEVSELSPGELRLPLR